MGLFGLSNAEALVLAERMRSKQAMRDREFQKEIHNAQIKQQAKDSAKQEEIANRKIAQIATEARKTEPFITLTASLYDGECTGEKICVRASDIKEIKGVKTNKEKSVYDESAYMCSRTVHKDFYETKLTLWDFSILHVKETVDEIQAKINESINAVRRAEIEILKDVFS